MPGLPTLLRQNVPFRHFWAGQTISLFGDQVSLLAIPLLAVLTLHADAGQMGLLGAAEASLTSSSRSTSAPGPRPARLARC